MVALYGSQVVYLLIYVDDIILTTSSPVLLQQIIDSLRNEFDMTDLGALNYFLGISATRTPTIDTESKLGPEGVLVLGPTLYRILAGGLQYLTFTRPDMSYAVQQICLYMHDLREPHFAALKRILRYVQRMWILVSSCTFPLLLLWLVIQMLIRQVVHPHAGLLQVIVYFWVIIFCRDQLNISTLSLAPVPKAEYRGVANVVAETAWLRNLLRELHSPLSTATLIYYDNVSVVYMSANPVQHQRTKHIEIDIHFVRDMVTVGQVRVLQVPSRYQYADIFKGLPSALFEDFRSSLSVHPSPAQTVGAY
ncbi:ribonuclease H-like domain-containing protein [Tanacetum coccineum]